jgi:hypothetical protein
MEAFALALIQEWDPESFFMFLTLYIDESGTHESGMTLLGGVIAKLSQWNRFGELWQRRLRNEGVSHFHGKDVLHRSGEFRGWTVARRNNFVDRCADITLKNTTLGFSVMLRDAEYKEHYLGPPAIKGQKRPRHDSRYGLCFRSVLTWLPSEMEKALRRDNFTINVVLESGHPNVPDAERIFNEFKKEPGWAERLGGIGQRDKKALSGLQAADSMAYIAFRGEQHDFETIDRPQGDDYFRDRKKVKSRSPLYRTTVKIEYMKALRQHRETQVARNRKIGPRKSN